MDALCQGRPVTSQQIRTMATAACKTMGETDGYESARQIGDHVLGAIAENGATPLERNFAGVARQAAQNVSPKTAADCQRLALQVLGAGVSGPMTVALSTLARAAMDKGCDFGESRTIGRHFLHGITECAEQPEVLVLARTAEQAADAVGEARAGIKCEKTALDALAGGLRHGTLRTLRDYGREAMKVERDQDAYNVGKVVLQAIYDNATDPAVQFVAQAGSTAANSSKTFGDAIKLQSRTLKDL